MIISQLVTYASISELPSNSYISTNYLPMHIAHTISLPICKFGHSSNKHMVGLCKHICIVPQPIAIPIPLKEKGDLLLVTKQPFLFCISCGLNFQEKLFTDIEDFIQTFDCVGSFSQDQKEANSIVIPGQCIGADPVDFRISISIRISMFIRTRTSAYLVSSFSKDQKEANYQMPWYQVGTLY